MKSLNGLQNVIISQSRFFSYLCSRRVSRDDTLIIKYEIFNTKLKNSSCANLPLFKPKILKGIKKNVERIWSRSTSTKEASQIQENKSTPKTLNKKISYVVPSLSLSRINEINTITGISIGVSHISWVKICIPSLTLLDWNVKLLPANFRSNTNEPNILKLAYDVNHVLPSTDLYVMETFSLKGRELLERVNEIHLSSMLTVLLNGFDTSKFTEPGWKDKVVFQKHFVLNNLHDLLLESERVSTRRISESIMNKSLKLNEDSIAEDESSDIYSSIKIHPKFIDLYKVSYLEKKEDLSLAFLLTLSFIDVNILKNETSLLKIQTKKIRKLKKFL